MIPHATENRTHAKTGLARRTTLTFIVAFLTASSYVVSRAVADAAFLDAWGPAYLPYAFLASSLCLVIFTSLYTLFGRPTMRGQIAQAILLTIAALTLFLAHDMPGINEHRWSAALLYLLAEIRGALGTILLAVFLNERFTEEESKSKVGLIGFGSTIAGVLFGGLIGLHAANLHSVRLLWFAVAMDVVACLPVHWLGRMPFHGGRGVPVRRSGRNRRQSRATLGWLRRHFEYSALLAGAVALKTMVGFLVDYLWKSSAADEYSRTDDLIAYFGWFYGGLSLSTAALQLTLTRWLVRRPRSVWGVMTLPVAQGAALTAILAAPQGAFGFAALQMAKGCDAFKRAVNDPMQQILYGPIPPVLRRKVIAIVTGGVKPVAEALAGLALIPLADHLHDRQIVWAAAVLILFWATVALRCARMYDRRVG